MARTDFTWAAVERECGRYNFSAYDSLLSSLAPFNVTPYWILDYNSPCYPPPPGAPARSCASPACAAGYARLAAAAGVAFH